MRSSPGLSARRLNPSVWGSKLGPLPRGGTGQKAHYPSCLGNRSICYDGVASVQPVIPRASASWKTVAPSRSNTAGC
eukprot:4848627-Heterocapsa_arctica.AAC.1